MQHLAITFTPFYIRDQIGLWCASFIDQFADGDSGSRRYPQSFRHMLSSCTYAIHGNIIRSLQVVLEAAMTASSQTSNWEIVPPWRIHFLREFVTTLQGCERKPKEALSFQNQALGTHCRHSRRKGIVKKNRRYKKTSNCVRMTVLFFLVESTIPWEDRLDLSNALKKGLYLDLSIYLEARG